MLYIGYFHFNGTIYVVEVWFLSFKCCRCVATGDMSKVPSQAYFSYDKGTAQRQCHLPLKCSLYHMMVSYYSLYKAVWLIPKLLVIAYKKCLLLKINTVTKFLLFKMKYVINGGNFCKDRSKMTSRKERRGGLWKCDTAWWLPDGGRII